MSEIAIPNSYLMNGAARGGFKVPKKNPLVLHTEQTVSSDLAPDTLVLEDPEINYFQKKVDNQCSTK